MRAVVLLLGCFLACGACLLRQDLGSDAREGGEPTETDGSDAREGGEPTEHGGSAATTDARPTDAMDAESSLPNTERGADAFADSSTDARADADAAIAYDCNAYVEVGAISPTTCAVVDPVSHRVGLLQWRCAGGPAHLTLDGIAFTGSVTGDTVALEMCREDPVSWLDGHFEVVQISLNVVTKSGSLTFARATGLACAKAFADCTATAGVTLKFP